MQALEYLSQTPKRNFRRPEQVIETSKGRFTVELFAKEAPNAVNSFVFLALHRYFEGIVWHRVIPGFVAQTGDPTGTGGPGYGFGLEVAPHLNYDRKGRLGMARTQNPNSNGSQFFITFAPIPHLNQHYSIFGQVSEGMEVVEAIAPTEGVPSPARGDARDKIVSVKIFAKGK